MVVIGVLLGWPASEARRAPAMLAHRSPTEAPIAVDMALGGNVDYRSGHHARRRGRQPGTARRYSSYAGPKVRASVGSSYQRTNAATTTQTAPA
jgi:hypothetical protein